MPQRMLLTVKQAADLLGYCPEHVRRLCRQGAFSPALVAGRSYLFAASDLRRWAKKHKRAVTGS